MNLAWWEARSASEQRLLAIGACAILAMCYFLLVLEPLWLARERALVQVNAERTLAGELATLAAEAATLRGRVDNRTRFDPGASLTTVINTSAARAGTQAHTRRMTPLGKTGVTLFLDDVPFTELAAWLATLDAQHGIEVERAMLETRQPGLVNAQLTLRARGVAP